MKHKRLQLISFILLILSALTELSESQGWVTYQNPDFVFGLSLGFILVSLSFNIKVIRAMGIPEKDLKQSRRLAFITAVYAFLVFALELF
ncbi:hypothetical protein [Roseivirga sp.]|uniref:hypothetical protein n=1 Tax=Roseivirga sp. TaxID=1964215 RepID=UPI003B8CE8DF